MAHTSEKRLVALRFPGAGRLAREIDRAWAGDEAVLPVDPSLPEPAVRALLETTRPHVLRDPDGETELANPTPVASGVAAVVTTSGTTGAPKAVELGRAALEAAARLSLARLGASPEDRWLCCVPLYRIAGLGILVRARLAGSVPVVHEGFDPSAIEREKGVTLVSLVPTMLHRLLEAGADLTRFRRILVGGGPTDPRLLARAQAAGAVVVRTYGMTETCGGVVYDGVPLEEVVVTLEEDGGVCLGGPTLMNGYRRDPAGTRAVLRDGLLRTMDVGRFEEGRLVVERRRDDVAITGGEKVSLGAAAALLEAHPRVRRAVVTAQHDQEWGERLVAYVEPVEEDAPPEPEDLRAFVRARAARFMAPREIVVVKA